MQAEVPTSLVTQAQRLIDAGWFGRMDDILLDALRRFLDSHRDELMEDFIRQDMEWGLEGDGRREILAIFEQLPGQSSLYIKKSLLQEVIQSLRG
ncbi:hypothetical protein PGN35_007740 [Nodosilinea sp. PGN35]|uniref:hypothetical protein n=1 Tax=Nodosilinea sp. PGN35 TaxID=3020489 RepID=UPI0023B2FCC8|nr:hypothetical protein [Nodosilinea sp. TSF1-S3]MDF0367165.1 hypothetical protein [Nodosilinea sp. TSF1-S3]